MRLLVSSTLAAALLAGAPVAADYAADLAPLGTASLLDGAFTAEAAFIRRGKIKQRPSIGYKVVVVVGDDTPDPGDDPATVEVSFPSVAGGDIPDQTLPTGKRRRAHFKGLLSQYPATYSFEIELENGSVASADIDPNLPIGATPVTIFVGTAFGGPDEMSVTFRPTNTPGVVRAVVFSADKFWDPSVISEVRFTDGETTDVLPWNKTITRFTKNIPASQIPAGFEVGSSYTMTTSVKNAAGEDVATSTTTETVGDVGVGRSHDRIRVATTADGSWRVVNDVQGTADNAAVVQVLATADDGTVVIDSLNDMAASTTRVFGVSGLTFEDPTAAAGSTFGVIHTALDQDGNTLGATDYEVVVEGLDEDFASRTNIDGTDFTINIAGQELSGRAGFAQDDSDSFSFGIVLDGIGSTTHKIEIVEIEQISLTVPPPPFFTPLADEAKRFLSVGDVPVDPGTGGSLDVLLLDDADQVLDSWSGSFSSAPSTVYNAQNASDDDEKFMVWTRNWRFGLAAISSGDDDGSGEDSTDDGPVDISPPPPVDISPAPVDPAPSAESSPSAPSAEPSPAAPSSAETPA